MSVALLAQAPTDNPAHNHVVDSAVRTPLTTLEARPRVPPRTPRAVLSPQLTMSRCASLACFWLMYICCLVIACFISKTCCLRLVCRPRVSSACIEDSVFGVSFGEAVMGAWLCASVMLLVAADLIDLRVCREEPRMLLTQSRGTLTEEGTILRGSGS